MKKIIFKKSGLFFTFLILATTLFLVYSSTFLLKNYKNIEEKENNKNISILLTLLNEKYKDYTDFKDISLDIKNISLTIFDFTEVIQGKAVNFQYLKEIKTHNFTRNNIQVFTQTKDDFIINHFLFIGKDNKIDFILKTKNYRAVLEEGVDMIYIFSFALIFFLLLIVVITYLYEKTMVKINESLEDKVKRRTKQINNTLKELESLNMKLYDLAHTDHLTQIKNRRSFFLFSKTKYDDIQKKHDQAAVIMIDIDDFKTINDTYGHDFGDRVLKAFASCISNNLSDSNVFGRLGGEEFAIFIPNANSKLAFEKAEMLRKKIESLKLTHDHKEVKITASFGVSDNIDTKNIDDMIRKADKQLYSAKESGKNRVRYRE